MQTIVQISHNLHKHTLHENLENMHILHVEICNLHAKPHEHLCSQNVQHLITKQASNL